MNRLGSGRMRLIVVALVTIVAVIVLAHITSPPRASANVTADAGYAPQPVLHVVLPVVPTIPVGALVEQQRAHLGVPSVLPGMPVVQTLDVSVSGRRSLQSAILVAINDVRTAKGLRSLRMSPLLSRAAFAHARALALAGAFEHEWPDGRPFQRWILRYYPLGARAFWSSGENLLWMGGDLTAPEAIRMWLASPEHRRNMLDPRWREIGVGVVHADGAGGAFSGHVVDLAATEFGVRS